MGAAAIDGTGNIHGNILLGNSAANRLDGGAGADEMRGGGGDDTYVVDNVGDQIFEISPADGIDLVRSSVTFSLGAYTENLVLTGNAAIDGNGNSLVNSLTGNNAANILNGGGGADTMAGGGGDDTYVIDQVGDIVVEAAGNGTDLVRSPFSYFLGAGVENLTLTGSAFGGTGNGAANTLTGNALDNFLDGGLGADTMQGGLGNDDYVVDNGLDKVTEAALGGLDTVRSSVTYQLSTEVENLVLTGSAAIDGVGNALANSLTGNIAANRLDGGLGADLMRGGGGDDTYIVNRIGDTVLEVSPVAGFDTVRSSVSFSLGDFQEALVLTGTTAINGVGNTQANSLTGNEAANRLDGSFGADQMRGLGGDDTYIVDQAGDIVIEAAGNGTDTVRSGVSYRLSASVENLILTSSAFNGTGNDAANIITGNDLANNLDGGLGADIMRGGLGNDNYAVDNGLDRVVEAAGGGFDTVTSPPPTSSPSRSRISCSPARRRSTAPATPSPTASPAMTPPTGSTAASATTPWRAVSATIFMSSAAPSTG